MDSREIKKALTSNPITKDVFLGVYPCDQLPMGKPVRKPAALVANTDPADKPGEHWVAMYLPSDGGMGEYFDSYGELNSIKPQFSSFLSLNAKDFMRNRHKIQGLLSSACGQYCIYYLIGRCAGIPMDRILGPLDHPFVSDAFVTAWVNKRFRLSTNVFDDDHVLNQMCSAFRQ